MTTSSKLLKIKLLLKTQLLAISLGGLVACSSMQVNVSGRMLLPCNAPIGVAAFANHSDTPLANRQVESMVVGLLRARGFVNVKHYERAKSCAKLLYCPDETLSRKKILAWARANHLAYVVTGAANEWRYKVGLDGEPVAGAAITLIQVRCNRIVWTGVGSMIGGSRAGLDVIGQKLLTWMLYNNVCPILH
jgi:polysaccharide biosynthesis protein PelC